ncbi:MAG: tRNA (N6-threonylcarbamoyladenosine(37)-N6)-methyltransferase TrmO [Shouchella clausii]|jgi:tRNA (adenine37-N6)-methyltransferase
MTGKKQTTTIEYIGHVRSPRTEMTDDHWGSVISEIVVNEKIPLSALKGLDSFSHLEIVFHMDQVDQNKIVYQDRHPRNNTDWPSVGIFAQRAKGRPNAIGVSRCALLKMNGNRLTVKALDAIDGTPVIDIKPYVNEFGPIGEVRQPGWITELMKNYYKD